MIGRIIGALIVSVLLLTGCATSTARLPAKTRCGHSTQGMVCVQVVRTTAGIGDVIGYYSPAVPLTGRTWRLDLVRYDCDPSTTRTTCRPVAQYPAAARHAAPPLDGRCVAVLYDSGSRRCTNRLAQAMATHGDWSGLPVLPEAPHPPTHTWLCVSAQLSQGKIWHNEFARSAACYP